MNGRAGSVLAQLPLFAVFLLAPLALVAGKITDRAALFGFFGPQGMGLFAALAAVALLASLGANLMERSRQGRPARPGLFTSLGVCLGTGLAVVLLHRHFGPQLAQAKNLAPLLDELRLPALALFAGLWAAHFGLPERAAIARLGGALGALVTLDFLATAISARGLVLGGGLFLGGGPATAEALGTLLCLALCATLDEDAETLSPLAALPRWLILAGLFCSFSRPGLGAAGLCLLLAARGPWRTRLALAGLCLLGVWMSLNLPLPRLATGREELGLAWYFSATIEALGQNPLAPFLGLPLNEPLALAVSEDWQGLDWDQEATGLSVSIFEVPSSGLRLLAAWGAGGPIAVLAGALLCVLPGRTRFGFGLLAATLVCGALSPALHVPATAGALFLCLAAARGAQSVKEDAPGGR